MAQVDLNVSESVTFPEAIAFTQKLLNLLESRELNDREVEEAIAALVKSENGARGFFVTYLTDDRTFANNPSSAVIEALKSSPNIVSELLVKNLAMSAAMAITHSRNENEEMVKSSQRVTKRTANLMEQLQLKAIAEKLHQLSRSISTNEGEYQFFLQKWDYDAEQRQVIQHAISQVNL